MGGVPTPVILLAVVLVITAIIMNKTKLGRHIYAVGGNSQAARFSGISTAKVKFLVHTYSGIMAGLAGVVLASRMYSGQPTAGDGAEMDAIAAVVVGGTSMAGGSGKIGGTIIGGLIIGVLNNGLNLLNVNSFWQYVVKGTVILLAVFVDYLRNKKVGIEPGLRQKRFTAVGRFLSKPKFIKVSMEYYRFASLRYNGEGPGSRGHDRTAGDMTGSREVKPRIGRRGTR